MSRAEAPKQEKPKRESKLKFLLSEFIGQKWEKIPRLMRLSGLSENEIDELPNNKLLVRFITAF